MNRENQPASRKQASAVIALGRKCARTAYPNPQRKDCPNVSQLRALACRDRRYKLTDLPVAHVATCSPCFMQYLRFRRHFVLITAAEIGTVCVLLFLGIFVSVKIVRHGGTAPTIAEYNRDRPPAPELPKAPLAAAPLPIEVSLEAFSPLRGDSPPRDANKIHLPAKPLRIRVRLPIGMEPGQYTVQLLDPAGKAVLDKSVNADLADGMATFVMDVDLNKAAAHAGFTMMIRPPGLSWRKYPVVID